MLNWLAAAATEPPSPTLSAAFGMAQPNMLRIDLPQSRIPAREEVQQYLLPSLCAVAVDDQGVRVILRESFPLATWMRGFATHLSVPVGESAHFGFSFRWDW